MHASEIFPGLQRVIIFPGNPIRSFCQLHISITSCFMIANKMRTAISIASAFLDSREVVVEMVTCHVLASWGVLSSFLFPQAISFSLMVTFLA